MKNFYLLFLFTSFLSAQEFYITDFDVNTEVNSIKLVDENFNVTHLADFFIPNGSIMDIAFSPNGTLYGITSSSKIIEIDLINGTYAEIASAGGNYNNLVCTANNELVMLSITDYKLLTFDLNTLTVVSDVWISAATPGDLTYFKGNLLFQHFDSLDMYRWDGVQIRRVACGDDQQLFGLSNYTTDCESNLVYAFDQGGEIYHYDVENDTLTLVADLSAEVSEVYGTATVNEYLASTCTLENLESVNCNLSISETTLSEISIYPNPASEIIYIKDLHLEEELYYSLYSLDGKLLDNALLTSEISIERLAKGVYFLQLHNARKNVAVTKRFLKI